MSESSASTLYENYEEHSESDSLTLKGSIGFDNDGNKVLVNSKGKAFAIDDTILRVWRELERLNLEPVFCYGNVDTLVEHLRISGDKSATVKSIVSKLASHNLVSF